MMNVNLDNEILLNQSSLRDISINVNINNKTLIYKITKNFMDVIGGIFGVILLLPLTAIIYIANKLSNDEGPIFYTQERIGKDGKIFKMYKYRSMVVDADKKLEEYLQENEDARVEYNKYKKLKNDPRITKIGKFIRKTSLDEFPQFINVLKGEMSLVGPRPYLLRERKDMGVYYDYIIKCKPGLTCIWQTNGRNDVDFNERLQMDLTYVKEKRLKMDLSLIIKTVKKLVEKEGAM